MFPTPITPRARAGRSRLSIAKGGLFVLATLACAPALTVREGLAPPLGFEEVVASEEAIVQLGPELKRLDHSVLNLQLPDESTRGLFGDFVEVLDLVSVELATRGPLGTSGLTSVGDAAAMREVSREELALWRPLMDHVEYFERAKFYVIRGHLLLDGSGRLETEIGFEALARVAEGRTWFRGELMVTWTAGPSLEAGGPPTWSIVSWRSEELKTMSVDRPLFAEVLDEALDAEALVAARRSIHEELSLEYLLDPEAFEQPKYFGLPATDRHPGVAITDLDGDGFDDLYVMARWGPNQFFRNRGNGTFEEIAGQIGLDLVSIELTTRSPLGTVAFASVGDVGAGRHVSREELALWRPLLDHVEYFEHAKFYVIRGHLLLDGSGRLETEIGFEALARAAEGRTWFRGELTVT